MKLADKFSIRGDLGIYLDYGNGKEKFFEEQNLIVNAAKLILLKSVYLSSSTDYISSLRVGTGGTVDVLGVVPKMEEPTQTGLITVIPGVSSSVNGQDIPGVATLVTPSPNEADLSVTFLASIDNSKANGYVISEVGLFTTGGSMFNVKNHPGITKSSSFAVHYEWTIRIL
jgi:hypothetical protein